MRFGLNQEKQIFLDSLRRFLRNEHPISRARLLAEEPGDLDRAWWQSAASLGWTGLLVRESYGGFDATGDGLDFLIMLAEESGRALAPGPLISSNVVADTLSRYGSEEQKADVLPRVAAGDLVAGWCASHIGGGLGGGASTDLTRTNDGYMLQGSALQMEAPSDAAYFLITSTTDGGPTQLLVPADSPGVRVQTQEGLDLTRRFGQVAFRDVQVPASALVGNAGGAGPQIRRQRQVALLLQCADSAGAAARVLEFTLEWAFDRYSFGRPLASYQALKHRFADMKLWLEACFATTDGAVQAVREGGSRADKLVAIAKAYVARQAPALIHECVQMHGGIGVTWEHDLHLYLRRIATNSHWLGGMTEHRKDLAAQLTLESNGEIEV